MKCHFCNHLETRVIDKRESPDSATTRRRRECTRCKKRFTTYESIEELELVVVKKDGKREPFSRIKLKEGVMKSCQKLPIPVEKVDELVDSIEAELRNQADKEIVSSKIGEMVMKRLRKLNKIAYIRFAAVYREFEGLEEFEKEIKKLVRR